MPGTLNQWGGFAEKSQ